MKSKVNENSKYSLLEASKKMSKAERLQAFVNHSAELAKIFHSGQRARTKKGGK